MHHAIVGIDHHHLLAHNRIAEIIFFHIVPGAVPSTQITPAEIGRDHVYVVCFFHYGDVNRRIHTLRIDPLDGFGFGRCVECSTFVLKQLVDLRCMFFECLQDAVDRPDKDSCIPQEVTARQKGLSHVEVGLLREGLHVIDLPQFRLRIKLDISISGVGMIGLDANGDQCLPLFYKRKRLVNHRFKCLAIHHQVIGRCRDHGCTWIKSLQLISDVSNASRCIFSVGLRKYLCCRDLGQLLAHQRRIFRRSNDVNILDGHHLFVAIHGLLDQGSSQSQYIQKLFGIARSTHRPKPTADPSGHHGHVTMFIHRSMKSFADQIVQVNDSDVPTFGRHHQLGDRVIL